MIDIFGNCKASQSLLEAYFISQVLSSSNSIKLHLPSTDQLRVMAVSIIYMVSVISESAMSGLSDRHANTWMSGLSHRHADTWMSGLSHRHANTWMSGLSHRQIQQCLVSVTGMHILECLVSVTGMLTLECMISVTGKYLNGWSQWQANTWMSGISDRHANTWINNQFTTNISSKQFDLVKCLVSVTAMQTLQ